MVGDFVPHHAVRGQFPLLGRLGTGTHVDVVDLSVFCNCRNALAILLVDQEAILGVGPLLRICRTASLKGQWHGLASHGEALSRCVADNVAVGVEPEVLGCRSVAQFHLSLGAQHARQNVQALSKLPALDVACGCCGCVHVPLEVQVEATIGQRHAVVDPRGPEWTVSRVDAQAFLHANDVLHGAIASDLPPLICVGLAHVQEEACTVRLLLSHVPWLSEDVQAPEHAARAPVRALAHLRPANVPEEPLWHPLPECGCLDKLLLANSHVHVEAVGNPRRALNIHTPPGAGGNQEASARHVPRQVAVAQDQVGLRGSAWLGVDSCAKLAELVPECTRLRELPLLVGVG
mmetsp:Transcript_113108/g.365381  ORF Transcript_113108/g.365381 Transcript_113108/m.365381 type:complete len:347 (+) Transcript_113108:165-1205(+)